MRKRRRRQTARAIPQGSVKKMKKKQDSLPNKTIPIGRSHTGLISRYNTTVNYLKIKIT